MKKTNLKHIISALLLVVSIVVSVAAFAAGRNCPVCNTSARKYVGSSTSFKQYNAQKHRAITTTTYECPFHGEYTSDSESLQEHFNFVPVGFPVVERSPTRVNGVVHIEYEYQKVQCPCGYSKKIHYTRTVSHSYNSKGVCGCGQTR